MKKVVDIGKFGYMWTSNNKTSVSGELTTSSRSLGTFRACSISKVSSSSWLCEGSVSGISTFPFVCVPDVTFGLFKLLLEFLL